MYVETDFLLALAKDDDWLGESAVEALSEYDDIHTSLGAYTEFFLYAYDEASQHYEIDLERAVTDLVDLVPVRPEIHERAVLSAAVLAVDHGLTPFDAIHAGIATATDERICSSERDYDDLDVERVPLEPE